MTAADTPVDQLFSGLYPELVVHSGPCPCGCGAILEDEYPPLPIFGSVPDSELAEAAAASLLVHRAVALARWVGRGRAVTPSRVLRPADALAVHDELGLAESLLPGADTNTEPVVGDHPGRRIRSANDLPDLHTLWIACVTADLIEVRGNKAYPGAGLAVWQEPADPAARIESWCALVSGWLQARSDALSGADGLESQFAVQINQFASPLLYSLAQEPCPLVMLTMAFVAQVEDESGYYMTPVDVLQLASAQARIQANDWLLAGALQPAEIAPDEVDALSEQVAELEGSLQLDLMAPGSYLDEVELMLAPLRKLSADLQTGVAVELTALGRYGLARLLAAHGLTIPRAGACVDAEPEDLLDQLADYLPSDAESETVRWLEALGPDRAACLERVMWSAAVPTDEGPVRRAVLTNVLRAAGPEAQPLLDAGASDRYLGPVVAAAGYELGLKPSPTTSEALWLTVDGLSVLGEIDELSEGVAGSSLEELLALPGGVKIAAGLDHPEARRVLRAAASSLDDHQLARSLRKALKRR